MASGAVVAAVKLTIPKRNEHIKERNILYKKYEELGTRIGELTRRRGELETTIQGNITNIKLDDAIGALNAANTEVQAFNTDCQNAQTAIDANNEALRELLASITTEIAQAKATKAAADAAAAAAAAQTAAEEAAALKKALQEYIASLRIQLQGINDNTLYDIDQQIQTRATTINGYGTELDTAVSGADETISQDTRDLIAAFKKDTGENVNSTTSGFKAFNQEFGQAKNAIVTELEERIRALQDVRDGANVTATQINDALEADKKNPIDDKNLGDIKGRAAELAAEFGTKVATEFATRKVEIEEKIEEDKRLFKEKKQKQDEVPVAEESVPEPKRTPGRRYSIFIPTPVQRKQSTTRTEAAAAPNSDNTEDAIDPTVLEIFVYEDDKEPGASVSTGAGAGAGGGFIQRGGEPPKVAKIIKVKQITPEIQKLFLSFESPNKTLTSEFLHRIEQRDSFIEVVDKPTVIDAEMKEMVKKKDEFIQNDDNTDFFESLGKKVDHKSTIMKLMKWMTTELYNLHNSKKNYETLYEELWRFMKYEDCVGIINNVVSVSNIKKIKQTENQTKSKDEKKGLQQMLGWTSRTKNTLYDNLLMEISKCEEQVTVNGKQELRDTGKYSKFIHKRFEGRGYRFMLNWLILIALHVYNAESNTEKKTNLLERCGEFIEKLHNVFIQWMNTL